MKEKSGIPTLRSTVCFRTSVHFPTESFMEVKQFLLAVWSIFKLTVSTQSSVVSYAINAIINDYFAKLNTTWPGNVDIVCVESETKEFSALMAILVKSRNLNSKFKIIKVKLNKLSDKDRFKLNESSIVFFESMKSFTCSVLRIMWQTNPRKRKQHLVYVPGISILDIFKIYPFGYEIDQVNFLMNEFKEPIELVTAFIFTKQLCLVLQLKTINRFNFDSRKWEHSTLCPNKYGNLHGCRLMIQSTLQKKTDERNRALMFMIFQAELNAYQIEVSDIEEFDCETCDLTRDEGYLLGEYDDFVLANPHDYMTFTFVVPPDESYTDLEMMFMMFSVELWIAIIVTLIVGFLITLSLHLVSGRVRNFIAGRGSSYDRLCCLLHSIDLECHCFFL